MDSRPYFFPLWRKLLSQDFKDGDYAELVPWKLALCILGGFCLVRKLDYDDPDKIISLILIAILTANGIIAAIIINSIQQVLSNISEPKFAKFLRESNALDYYMYFIIYFQGILVFALIVIVSSIFIMQVSSDINIKIYAVSLAVGMFFYSLVQTISSTILVRDLIYYRSLFREHEHKQ